MKLGPLLKLTSKVNSLDRLSRGKVYPAKHKEDFIEYKDNNNRIGRIRTTSVNRYFTMCDCGSWSGGHSDWCVYIKGWTL